MKKLATILVTTAFTLSLLSGLAKTSTVHVQAGVSQAEIDQVWQKIRQAEAEVNQAEAEFERDKAVYEQSSKLADEKAKQLTAQKKKLTDLKAEVDKLKAQKETDKLTAKQAELEKLGQQVEKLGQEDDEAALKLQQNGDKHKTSKQNLQAKRRAYEQVKRHAFSTETLKVVGDALTKQTSTETTTKEIAAKQTELKNKVKEALQKADKPDLSDTNKNNSYIDKTNKSIKAELEKLKNYVQPKPGVPALPLTPAKKNVPQGQEKPKSEPQQAELDLNSLTADELEEYIEEQTQELDDIILRLNNKEGEDAEAQAQAELKQTQSQLEKKIAELKAQLAKIKQQATPDIGMPMLKLNPAKKVDPQAGKQQSDKPQADMPSLPQAPTLEEMRRKSETAERIAKQAENELTRTEMEIKRLQAEKENNAKLKEKLEQENDQLVQELTNKGKDLEAKKAKLKEAEAKIEALKKTPEQIQSVIKEANELKSQINNLEEELEKLVVKEKENKDEIGRTTNIYNNAEELYAEKKAQLPQIQAEAKQKREAAEVAKKAYAEAKAKQPSPKPAPLPKPQPQPQAEDNDQPNNDMGKKPSVKPNIKQDEANNKQENGSQQDNGNKKQLDKRTEKKPNTKVVPVPTTKAEEKVEKVAEVKVLDAPKTAYQQGSNATVSVRFQAEPKDLQTVTVDGKIVDPMHYTVKRGSTIIELKASYLQKLGTGKHELVATFLNSGTKLKGTSSFEVTAMKRKVAKTGEASQAGLAMLSLLLAGATFLVKRR